LSVQPLLWKRGSLGVAECMVSLLEANPVGFSTASLLGRQASGQVHPCMSYSDAVRSSPVRSSVERLSDTAPTERALLRNALGAGRRGPRIVSPGRGVCGGSGNDCSQAIASAPFAAPKFVSLLRLPVALAVPHLAPTTARPLPNRGVTKPNGGPN